MLCFIHDLGPLHIAHCTENFISFPKHPSQVRFRSSVQILWKLLVCKDSTRSIQTNNFHKTWTDDLNLTCKGCFGKEKKFPIQWAMSEGARLWMIRRIWIWTFQCLIIKKCALQWFIQYFFGIQGTLEDTLGTVWVMFAVRNLNPMSKRTVCDNDGGFCIKVKECYTKKIPPTRIFFVFLLEFLLYFSAGINCSIKLWRSLDQVILS